MKSLRALTHNQCGAAAMEFALILPVLVALFGGVMQYGRVLLVEQAVRDIIDSTARSTVLGHATSSTARSQVIDALNALPGVEEFNVTVTDGSALSINVTGSFDLVMGQFLPAQSQSFSVSTAFPR